jgi:hypothetical protein
MKTSFRMYHLLHIKILVSQVDKLKYTYLQHNYNANKLGANKTIRINLANVSLLQQVAFECLKM